MWEAYYIMEPWGEDRADLRAGTIAAMIYNSNITSSTKPAHPKDFMIVRPEDFDEVKKKAPMTAESWAAFKAKIKQSLGTGKNAPRPKKWVPKRGRKKEAPSAQEPSAPNVISAASEPSIP